MWTASAPLPIIGELLALAGTRIFVGVRACPGGSANHGGNPNHDERDSPIADTPALILAALLGMPWFEVLASLTLGKGMKYIIIMGLSAKAAGQVIAYFELEDAKIMHEQKPGLTGHGDDEMGRR